MKKNSFFAALAIIALFVLLSGCTQNPQQNNNPLGNNNAPAGGNNHPVTVGRESKIPVDAAKITPETDANPVKSLSPDYEDPVPVPYPINTAGAEDSPFILPDGKTLYFFFTPDVRVPVEKQVLDRVTGIYVSKNQIGIPSAAAEWSKPERIMLQDSGKLAMDGCEFVLGNKMWFCSAREGYTGIHWFTAQLVNGKWQDWGYASDELKQEEFKTGELHINKYGTELYFHSDKEGGKGGLDIWMSKKINGEWQEPVNLEAVNSTSNEGWPALSPDETELWISKDYALWRSKKVNGEWQTPEKMFSPLAGEATIDNEGNVYFVHHYYKNDKMIEADIYTARKK